MTKSPRANPSTIPAEADSWRMFDRIAGRYDLLNRLLSMRRDVAWRKRLAKSLPDGEALRVLDLATGTADVLLNLHANTGRVALGIGVDKSPGMLEIGKEKVRDSGAKCLSLVRGDAEFVGFQGESFDAVTIAFGIRNVPDVPAALREMHRVLRPGGRALILECSVPANPLLRAPYLVYFRHILPRIGGYISGDADAYRYLNLTVEAFPRGEDFCALMRDAGFENVTHAPLTFGVAALYTGDRA